LDGFEQHRSELESLGASIVAASVDDEEKAGEIADGKGFPFGHGVTRADADALGSWWEERRGIIQPSEFLLNAENKVMASSYSDGPIGRIDAADVIKVINFYESQKAKG
jgi:peroxiredoxin